ncbi:hypothetical protein CJ235_06405 [Staphylococcus pettenkoferi]|uniref:Uncharacterized protein n=1 Tax=Staphylococcus pettenkoferi TaxID=170573 RepID=A0A1Z3U1P4_9STAP|nr:hypothetical protein CEP67_07150 [Staphylococcus pettenkoferi]PMC18897.1 hypothetical protein CJ235_06405 [Staphylococcus pettenkoferi]
MARSLVERLYVGSIVAVFRRANTLNTTTHFNTLHAGSFEMLSDLKRIENGVHFTITMRNKEE